MKWLKHILVMIALLAAAMPCCHGSDHDMHHHDVESATELCADHSCACHSCDDASCAEPLDFPQESVSISVTVPQPKSVIELICFAETRPVVLLPAFQASDALSSLRTIRLLI